MKYILYASGLASFVLACVTANQLDTPKNAIGVALFVMMGVMWMCTGIIVDKIDEIGQ